MWACERFNAYIEGAPFDLVTDHKPLEIIFGKCGKPSARIERWVLRLQKYQYNVVYVPGPKNITDLLSRLLGPEKLFEPVNHHHEAEEYVRFVAVECVEYPGSGTSFS